MSSYDAAIVDLAMLEDPRLLECSRGARFMAIEALVYCRAHRTDGAIKRGVLARIAWDEPDVTVAAAQLVKAGVWAATKEGWQLVDYLTTQWSKDKVERKREQSRARFERWQEKESAPGPKRVGSGVANAPDLTRPDPKGKEGKGRRSTSGRALGARPSRPAELEKANGYSHWKPALPGTCDECLLPIEQGDRFTRSTYDRLLHIPACLINAREAAARLMDVAS